MNFGNPWLLGNRICIVHIVIIMKMKPGLVMVIFLKLSFFATQVSTNPQQSQLSQCSIRGYSPWLKSSINKDDSERSPQHSQFIVSEDRYKFNCYGNVTEWAVNLSPRGDYTVELQVWRESTMSRSGCYSLVGANTLSTSVKHPHGSLVTLDIRSTPASQIPVQPGDVVGFYVVQAPTETSGGINLNKSSTLSGIRFTTSFTNSQQTLCLETISYFAPLISVSVVKPLSTIVTASSPSGPGSIKTMSTIVTASSPSGPGSVKTMSTIVTASSPSGPGLSSPTPIATSVLPALVQKQMSPSTNNIPMRTPITTARNVQGSLPIGLAVGVTLGLLTVLIIIVIVIVTVIIFLKKGRKKINTQSANAFTQVENPNYGERNSNSTKTEYNSESNNTYTYINSNKNINSTIKTVHEVNITNDDQDYENPSPSHGTVQEQQTTPEEQNDYEVESPEQDTETSRGLYEDVFDTKTQTANVEIFESAGIYVPTEKQREQIIEGHYDIGNTADIYDKTKFFVEDEIYWAPASTTSGLYEQLAAKRYREIPRQQIGKQEELGKGQFGEVFKSTWAVSGATLEVAVKMLRTKASEDDEVKFLQEAAIMGQFMHPNIVKLYGVVTVGEPIMICLEMLKNGDLRSYLNKLDKSEANLQHRFLRFAREIATGMDYLSRKSFVHRDLAARNILLNDSLTCKIGDFGMARDLMDDTYYTSHGGQIPVKWTAPEALFYKKYSTDSDVWSYGMVLYEIWSIGKKPFSEHTNKEVMRFIQKGYCQAPPPGCPRPIYQLMVNCWHPQHDSRPKFKEISAYLKQPASQLLALDSSLSPEATTLGEELEHGKQLYMDLQQMYKKARFT